MKNLVPVDEVTQIRQVHKEFRDDADSKCCDDNAVSFQGMKRVEAITQETLNMLGVDRRIGELDILDVGCGNGHWLKRWQSWGASAGRLTGVDLRESDIDFARQNFSESHFVTMRGGELPFPDASFDIVFQNCAFSSILSTDLRKKVAAEIKRVLKPCGLFLSWDLAMNSPNNPTAMALRKQDLSMLFPEMDFIRDVRITLAPHLANWLASRSIKVAGFFETAFPFLRTHLFDVLQKRPAVRDGISIRVAVKADVDALVELHLSSFTPDNHLGMLLGADFVRASYYWHLADKRGYVIVAELNGRLAGLLGMCDGPFTIPMLWACRWTFLRALLRHPRLLTDRRLWRRLKREKVSVKWVSEFCSWPNVSQMTIGAVAATARGHNVFPLMIKHCDEINKAHGVAATRAGVYRENLSCQRAFVKSGWTEIPELGSSETVYFVRVFSSDLLKRFPDLVLAGVKEAKNEKDI